MAVCLKRNFSSSTLFSGMGRASSLGFRRWFEEAFFGRSLWKNIKSNFNYLSDIYWVYHNFNIFEPYLRKLINWVGWYIIKWRRRRKPDFPITGNDLDRYWVSPDFSHRYNLKYFYIFCMNSEIFQCSANLSLKCSRCSEMSPGRVGGEKCSTQAG